MVLARAIRRVIWWSAVAAVAGCGQRERPTFPTESPGNSAGPVTEILQPEAPDTTVVEGDLVFVEGRASDPDGVDTVYFEIGGLNQSLQQELAEPLGGSIPCEGLAGASVETVSGGIQVAFGKATEAGAFGEVLA